MLLLLLMITEDILGPSSSQKSEAFKAFKNFSKMIQNEKDLKIKVLRSDHGGEF